MEKSNKINKRFYIVSGEIIDEVKGIINETKIDKATMMEVFVYYTGEELKE